MSVAEMPDVQPAVLYERPFDVLRDMTLTRVEKIEILHRWLADVVRMASGQGETPERSEHVCAVTKALQFLGAPTEVS